MRKRYQEECPHYREKPFQAWSANNLLKLFIDAFIAPFFRLAKQGILLKRTQPIRNIFIDLLCISLVFSMMGMFHLWKGILVLSMMVTTPFLIGGFYKVMCYAVSNIRICQQAVKESNVEVIEPVKVIRSKSVKSEVVSGEVPNFDEKDLASWSAWIRENPGRVIVQGKIKQ